MNTVPAQVNDVEDSSPVDVREANTLGIEVVRRVEPGRGIHRDLRAKAAIPEVRPIADLSIPDADHVDESVAVHVPEMNRLRRLGGQQPWTAFFIGGNAHALRRSIPVFAERLVPDKKFASTHQ